MFNSKNEKIEELKSAMFRLEERVERAMDELDNLRANLKKAQGKEKDEEKVWVVDHNYFNEYTVIWPASLEKGYHYLVGDKVVQMWAVGNEHSVGIDVKNDKYIYFENSRVDGFILTQKINVLKGVPVVV